MRYHVYAAAVTAVVLAVVLMLPHPADWAQWACVLMGIIGSYVFFLHLAMYLQDQANPYARGNQEAVVKGLDMPPNNGECETYSEFLRHASTGRAVGVVPIVQSNGRQGTYIYSGIPDDDSEPTIEQAIRMIAGARNAALRNRCAPVP